MKEIFDQVRSGDYSGFSDSIRTELKNKMQQNEYVQDYVSKISEIQRKIDLYQEIKQSK